MTADSTIAMMDVAANKPGPSVSTIITAAKILVEYGHFKWSKSAGFQMGRHESTHFEHWLDEATRAGRLTKGAWRKKTWIGFAVPVSPSAGIPYACD